MPLVNSSIKHHHVGYRRMNTNAVVSALSIFEYIMSIHLYLTKDAKDERK